MVKKIITRSLLPTTEPSMLHSTRKQGSGFTLIEVLVALFIIAIALTAAIQATNSSIQTTTRLRETLSAHWVGLNVLSEMQTGILTLTGEGDVPHGSTQMLMETFDWAVTKTNSSELSGITRVEVHTDLRGQQLDTVTGYILDVKK